MIARARLTVGEGHTVELVGGEVPLGPWGRIEVSGLESARVETGGGATLEFAPEVAQHLDDTVCWLDEADGRLLLVPRTEERILRVDLLQGVIDEVDWLVRDEDDDLRFVSVRPGPASALLILYERGLLCLEPDGRKRWHVLHDDLSAEIVAVDDDEVILHQQWPQELAGQQRKYRVTTGEPME